MPDDLLRRVSHELHTLTHQVRALERAAQVELDAEVALELTATGPALRQITRNQVELRGRIRALTDVEHLLAERMGLVADELRDGLVQRIRARQVSGPTIASSPRP